MTQENLLQNRINELNCAIINFTDKKVRVTGFYNEKMLNFHLEQNKNNYLSIGLYEYNDVTFSNIKSDALFLIQNNGLTVEKHKFVVLFRGAVQRLQNKGLLVITIRKNKFADQWQVITENKVFEFSMKEELEDHLQENYKIEEVIAF
ncbi:hypothetical protein ABZ756_00495 [Mammaliicoccus sciuri]